MLSNKRFTTKGGSVLPPKAKITREAILEAAWELTRENGAESVTAREIGRRLFTSVSPIFTQFRSMDEVKELVRERAFRLFCERALTRMEQSSPALKAIGVTMMDFAAEEPKLFRLLFLREHSRTCTFDEALAEFGDLPEIARSVIERDHGVCAEDARCIFQHIWIYCMGVGLLIADRVCEFSAEEISRMISYEFQAALLLAKSGEFRPIALGSREEAKNYPASPF